MDLSYLLPDNQLLRLAQGMKILEVERKAMKSTKRAREEQEDCHVTVMAQGSSATALRCHAADGPGASEAAGSRPRPPALGLSSHLAWT